MRNMIVLLYALGAVILMTHRAQCELSSDIVFRLLSSRLDDIVVDMKLKDKTFTKQIEDVIATVTTTNQRLESFEKMLSDISANNKQGRPNKQHGEKLVSIERRLNDLASCNQTVATFEKRMGDLEKYMKDDAAVEVGRRMHLLKRGLEQEKAATQLRFDQYQAVTEHKASTFLMRVENLEKTQGNLKSNIDDIKGAIDTQISDTKVQLSKVKQDLAGISHNASKVIDNLQKTMKNVTSETEVATQIARTTKGEVTTALQNTHNLISRVDAVERTQWDLKSKTNAIGTLVDATKDQISQLERITGTFFGFSVELSSDNTYVSSTTIKFDRVYYNVGSHYNTTTGIFTVPVSGDYVFMFNVEASNAVSGGTPAAHVLLRVNTYTPITEAFAQGQNMTGGNAAVIAVKAGDRVSIATATLNTKISQHFIGGDQTSFSGALLHVN